jgi:hypothetical protein
MIELYQTSAGLGLHRRSWRAQSPQSRLHHCILPRAQKAEMGKQASRLEWQNEPREIWCWCFRNYWRSSRSASLTWNSRDDKVDAGGVEFDAIETIDE